MRKYLKNLYDGWIVSRQISVCHDILGRHSMYLGPEHKKEIHGILSRLEATRAEARSFM